jgi:integrase
VATKITLWAAAEDLIDGMRSGRIYDRSGRRYKPSTTRGYATHLRIYILPEYADRRLSSIARRDLQQLLDRLQGEPHELSASTIRNILCPLQVIFGRALHDEQIAVDPTVGLRLAAPHGRRERFATAEEARVLIDALPEEDRALWATAFYANARRGELRALRLSDIDIEARMIRIERGWDDEEGEQNGKSEAARRRVPIIRRLAPILAAHLLATGRGPGDLVFGRTAHDPFVPSTVRNRALTAWGWKQIPNPEPGARPRKVWVKAREDALDPIGLHECRHTCASLMIDAGCNAKALSKIMGHASIKITYDIYGHLMPGGEDEARERIDAYLDRVDGGLYLRAVGESG